MDATLGIVGVVIGALLGGGATLLNTSRQNQAAAAVEKWKVQLEHRQKQLGELYGPLTMCRSTTRSLRRLLPSTASDGSEWRLVHYIGTIRRQWERLQQDPQAEPDPELGLSREQVEVARQIIEYGNKACDILDKHAGLIEGDRPGGLDKYQEHHTRLRTGWDTRTNQPVDSSLTFPGHRIGQEDPEGVALAGSSPETDVDAAIEQGMEAVREAHEDLFHGGPEGKKPLLGVIFLIIGLLGGVILIAYLVTDTSEDPNHVLVTTPDGALCGVLSVDDDGVAAVAGTPVPSGSTIEFVDDCH